MEWIAVQSCPVKHLYILPWHCDKVYMFTHVLNVLILITIWTVSKHVSVHVWCKKIIINIAKYH